MSNRSGGITAYVAGGLGNQLFILGAAWEQARRLDCPLYLDRSHFGVEGTRRFELDAISSPATVLGAGESWRSLRFNAERVLPIPSRWGRIFLERTPDSYMPQIERVRAGTTLVGYFQSPRYFPSVVTEILDSIAEQPETPAESELLTQMRAEPAVTLHLRRGDYLSVSADRQFIATVDYAVRSIRLLAAMGINLPIRVFSDSVDLVSSELSHVDADVTVVSDGAPLGIWATLKAMAAGHAMIMSNSSFSWWAASLMRQTTSSVAPIVAPRPWTLGGTAKADLLGRDWITLDAR